MAVVVSRIAAGPSTWYSWVTSRPEDGSFPVEAMESLPSDCRSFSVAGALRAFFLGDRQHLVLRSVSPM
jgi:hypothetical protein